MKLTFEIDEANILKMVNDGYRTDKIEQTIANDIKYKIREKVMYELDSKISNLISESVKNSEGKIVLSIAEKIKEILRPTEIAKMFNEKCRDKNNSYEHLYENIIEPTLISYLEYMIEEWCTIDISIGKKDSSKRKTISVVGTDSYHWRKK